MFVEVRRQWIFISVIGVKLIERRCLKDRSVGFHGINVTARQIDSGGTLQAFRNTDNVTELVGGSALRDVEQPLFVGVSTSYVKLYLQPGSLDQIRPMGCLGFRLT